MPKVKSARKRRTVPQAQLSFLSPDDALMVNMLRRFMAEASRIYEARTSQSLTEALVIRSPTDAYQFVRVEMESLEQEQLRTLSLDTRNKLISMQLIYQGALNTIGVRIAEVFRPALIANACAVVVCHNHPSGDPTPSPEDVALTKQLVSAGNLLGIELMDHLVIGNDTFVSLKSSGLGFD